MFNFPSFKNIDLADRALIESLTADYQPVSDYSFTSLWSWAIQGRTAFSILNKNLVIRFTDYISSEPFYSFLGNTETDKTVDILLERASKEGLSPLLRLVSEEVAQTLNIEKFHLTNDPSNNDYILSVDEMMTYGGNHLRGKRNFVNRFKRLYHSETRLLDLSDMTIQQQLKELFFLWGVRKDLRPAEIDNEYIALTRLFDACATADFLVIGVFVGDVLVGFSINEILNKEYAILHFEKADMSTFVGVYPFVMQETARVVKAHGSKFINYEQDLGIPGLKYCKESYHPCEFLKKFTISKVNNR